MLDLSEEVLKTFLVDIFFSKVTGLESIPAILIKSDSTPEVSLQILCKVALLKISENLLWDILAITSKQGYNFTENYVFDKIMWK